MKGSLSHSNLKLFLLQFCYWGAYCAFYSYAVANMSAHGYSNFECGLLPTVTASITILFQPVMGYLIDTFIPNKVMLIGCLLMSTGTVFLMDLFIGSLGLILLAVFIHSVFMQLLNVVIDNWTVSLREAHGGVSYPITRSGGSLGAAIIGFLTGLLITRFGYFVPTVSMHIIMALTAVVCAATLLGVPCKNRDIHAGASVEKKVRISQALKLLIANRPYLLFILSSLIFNFAARMPNIYSAIIIKGYGGNTGTIGLAVFVACISEMPALVMITHLGRRFRLEHLYMSAIGVVVASLLPNLFFHSNAVFIATRAVSSLGGATAFAVLVELIYKLTPKKLNATAMSLGVSVAFGLGQIAASFLGGIILTHVPIAAFFGFSVSAAALSFIVYLPVLLTELKQKEGLLNEAS